MAGERFFGVDRYALLASHVAFADADCSCAACRLRRGEIQLIIPRPRSQSKSQLGQACRLAGLGRAELPPAANDNDDG